jgi:hypothetical protein
MPSPFNLGQMPLAGQYMNGDMSPYPKTFGAARIDQASLDPINPGAGLSRTESTVGQPLNKANTGAAFQALLNQVVSDPAAFTPGYDRQMPTTGYSPEAEQLIEAFTKGQITGMDETGRVSVGPGGFNVESADGWSAGLGVGGLTFDSGKGFSARVNPQGAGVNIGPVGVQGTWAGDKSIQANVNFGRDKMFGIQMGMPRFMSEFMTPGSQPFNQGLVAPIGDKPQSEARKLMEQQTEEYKVRNPFYRYQ